MISIAEVEQKIKTELLKPLNELSSFLTGAVAGELSAHEVEEELWEQMLAFGHQALGLFFRQCGPGDEGETVVLNDGSTVKRLPELHTRPYQTVFGEFHLPRFVYGSRKGQKIRYVPLDSRLKLPAQKFSYLLQDWNQNLSTELPFGKVSESLSQILHFRQSVDSLEHSHRVLSESVGGFWDKLEMPSDPAKESAAQEGQLMVVTADCKGVVMRPNELQANPASSTSSKRPGNKKMALIGAAYTVDPYPRTPEQIMAALFSDLRLADDTLATRPKPIHKRVRGALLRNEAGKTDPQSATIFSWLADEARERSASENNSLVLIMDGQESLWNAGCCYLPEKDFEVTEILDLIHATQYVWTATHVFYAKGSTEATLHARDQIKRLLNNQVNQVITDWRKKAQQEKLSVANNETLETVCGYFTNHAHRMRYKDYLEQGLPIASGVIEGACRNVVKDRMEHSGMRWTMKGAHAMLELRSIQLSGLWKEFMQYWQMQEKQRLYELTKAANDEQVVLAESA